MNWKLTQVAFVCVISLALSSSTRAQFGPSGHGISATASESIKLIPERLRLIMWVKAQGNDPKSAIKALVEHKKRVNAELTKMKADEASIQFSATRLASGDGDSDNSQAQMYARMQMMQNGDSSLNEASMPKVYTATSALRAEWPLPIKKGDGLALLPATLIDQIGVRDLAGKKNKPDLDEAQKEQMEEMEAMMSEQYGGYYGQEDSSNSPKILFLSSVTDEQVKEATSAAYQSAVREVQAVADATNTQLGKVLSISRSGVSDNSFNYAYSGYSGYGGEEPSASFDNDSDNAVTAVNVDQLVKTVAITVTYAIAE